MRGLKKEREREKPQVEKKLYLCGILAGTTEMEPKLQKNLNSKNFKSWFCCSFSSERETLKIIWVCHAIWLIYFCSFRINLRSYSLDQCCTDCKMCIYIVIVVDFNSSQWPVDFGKVANKSLIPLQLYIQFVAFFFWGEFVAFWHRLKLGMLMR